ncbi:hypothetical protein INR49_015015 [Caranx melampygus]|nr:hypothetical protein INR49_015015 [Caranx melampygus]
MEACQQGRFSFRTNPFCSKTFSAWSAAASCCLHTAQPSSAGEIVQEEQRKLVHLCTDWTGFLDKEPIDVGAPSSSSTSLLLVLLLHLLPLELLSVESFIGGDARRGRGHSFFPGVC